MASRMLLSDFVWMVSFLLLTMAAYRGRQLGIESLLQKVL